jgi:hypothetical protein
MTLPLLAAARYLVSVGILDVSVCVCDFISLPWQLLLCAKAEEGENSCGILTSPSEAGSIFPNQSNIWNVNGFHAYPLGQSLPGTHRIPGDRRAPVATSCSSLKPRQAQNPWSMEEAQNPWSMEEGYTGLVLSPEFLMNPKQRPVEQSGGVDWPSLVWLPGILHSHGIWHSTLIKLWTFQSSSYLSL